MSPSKGENMEGLKGKLLSLNTDSVSMKSAGVTCVLVRHPASLRQFRGQLWFPGLLSQDPAWKVSPLSPGSFDLSQLSYLC